MIPATDRPPLLEPLCADHEVPVSMQNRALLALCSGIVHEATSPLGALQSSIQTFERVLRRLGSDPASTASWASLVGGARESVETSRASLERLSALVSALKEYVNLEEVPLGQADLCRVVRDALAGCEGTDIEVTVPEGAARVMADSRRLLYVVRALIDNALRSCRGKGHISVDVSREGERWCLEVRDQGVGMNREKLARAFEFGFTNQGGRVALRLGLPYAKLLMDEIGGEVRISSRQGEGTKVSLLFTEPVPVPSPERSRRPSGP